MPRLFVDITPLRRFPDFRRLWTGYAFRQLGAQITVTTVIYQVYTITHSNLAVGLLSLAQLGPSIFAPILGGSLADAIDRRVLLLGTAFAMSLCTVGLALNAGTGHPALWLLFVLSAVSWGLAGIDGPTRAAVQIALVDRESVLSANALRQVLQQGSLVVGPAAAGLLIAALHRHLPVVYWIDVASTAFALQAVLRLPPLPPEGGGRRFGFSSIVEGFSYLRGRQVIQACFLADLNANVLGLPVSLFPYMAFHHFHAGVRAYGLLMAAPGAGAALGSLLSGWSATIRRQGLAVLIAIAVWGLALVGFGLTTSLAVGIVLLAVAGWADMISATFRNTIIQVEVPDRLRGRLSSIQTAVVQSGPRLGNTEAGVVAALTTAQFSVVSGGVGCVLGIALIARFMPRFAAYRTPGLVEVTEG
ncbi:MAG TPA: MFS transporter [Acidimicrobiales bacterium]|nr:MFS transporter [Acidimicrobiales bacterium]